MTYKETLEYFREMNRNHSYNMEETQYSKQVVKFTYRENHVWVNFLILYNEGSTLLNVSAMICDDFGVVSILDRPVTYNVPVIKEKINEVLSYYITNAQKLSDIREILNRDVS